MHHILALSWATASGSLAKGIWQTWHISLGATSYSSWADGLAGRAAPAQPASPHPARPQAESINSAPAPARITRFIAASNVLPVPQPLVFFRQAVEEALVQAGELLQFLLGEGYIAGVGGLDVLLEFLDALDELIEEAK